MPRIARELDYSTPQETGTPSYEFPFEANGDFQTFVVARNFKQTPAGFMADRIAGRARPGVLTDREPPVAYLLGTSDPERTPTGLLSFQRSFARIPATQVAPTSLRLTKPAIEGIIGAGTYPKNLGDFTVFQPDTTQLSYDAYARQAVVGDTGAVTAFYPTGGTYTLTFAGSTTGAIAYNAAAATVQTALNLLTPVSNRGGVTVAGTYNSAGGFTITFASYAQATIDITSLTGPVAVSKVESLSNLGYSQNLIARCYNPPSSFSGNAAGIQCFIPAVTPGGAATLTLHNYSAGGNWQYGVEITPPSGQYIGGGTFTLTLSGFTTAPLAYNADFADVTAALNALGIGTFAATAIGGESNIAFTPYLTRVLITLVATPATGGTFTITVGANTTGALNYNDSLATISAAVNALTSVTNRGGATLAGALVTGLSLAFANAAMTAGVSSLTPTGANAAVTFTDGLMQGRIQKLVITSTAAYRDLSILLHGLASGDVLFVQTAAPAYFSGITSFQVIDANTVRLVASPSDAWAGAATFTFAGKRTKVGYQPGVMDIRAKAVTAFYLPGVTSGITTMDDIDLPVNQSDGAAFLTAVFAGGDVNVAVGQLGYWRGPILQLPRTVVRAMDV